MFWFRSTLGPVDLAFTDRFGGVSGVPYAELNLALDDGDAPSARQRNLELVRAAFAADAVLAPPMTQVHGAEVAEVEPLFYKPMHPYTKGLLASLPRLDRRTDGRLHRIVGQPPSLLALPTGCAFHQRCPLALPRCAEVRPELRELDGRLVACDVI